LLTSSDQYFSYIDGEQCRVDNLLGTVLRVYEIEEYLEKKHFVWRISLLIHIKQNKNTK